MRKLISFVALFFCAWTLQATPTLIVSDYDFGQVSIKGKTSVSGTYDLPVTWTDLPKNSQILIDIKNQPAEHCGFSVDGSASSSNIWTGSGTQWDPVITESYTTVGFGANAVGSYSCKLRFYVYDPEDTTEPYDIIADKTINITVEVIADAIVDKTIDFERVNSTSGLADDDVIIFVSESAGCVSGALNGTYLDTIKRNVTIDKTQGKAKVPETAQMFSVKKFSGNWQFTTTDTKKRLHLDITGKGAFTYANTVPDQILANWGVSISSGVAEVSKPDGTFPVEFNSDRFKPYKSVGSGTAIAIYKKVGDATDTKSKLNVEAIDFGTIEQDEKKNITVGYTTEYISGEILWDIEGVDKSLFSITSDATNKKITVSYNGGATKTGVLAAQVYAVFTNTYLDTQEEYFDIAITLTAATTKLTGLAFNSSAPTTIDQGQTIDLSPFIVYTPTNADDKSLTWTTDHDYQGTVTQDGKLTALHVTGTVKVTATSKKVPSVYAELTLTITKPTITDFTLSDAEVSLNINGTHTLSVATIVPDYALETPEYSSSDKTVATVSTKGVITGKALGDATITATIGSVSRTCKVHVVPVTLNGISFATSEADLTLGSSMQLKPIFDPASAESEYTVKYSSGNTDVATVDNTGKVSSVAIGDAVITAAVDGTDKSAQITIHVVATPTFAKVTDAASLAEKDTIILALANTVVAGKRDNKKLTVLTTEITATETEAYADNACRMVLGKVENQEGFTLTIVGATKPIAVAASGNDIVDANTTNCRFWGFVADGTNGFYIQNLGNTNAMFKYHATNAAIKPYKATTSGAVLVYVYVRKYVDPTPTNVENAQLQMDECTKVLRDGQIIIIRNGVEYTIDGKRK